MCTGMYDKCVTGWYYAREVWGGDVPPRGTNQLCHWSETDGLWQVHRASGGTCSGWVLHSG